jgi:hypothetical protein
MMVAFLILAISALLTAVVWWSATGAQQGVSTVEEWERKKYKVSARAFELLLDPQEEAYLRRSLTAHQFRTIQRKRIRFALDCAVRIGKNAGMLLQLAECVGAASDGPRADAARELATLAMRVRLSSFMVVWCLRLKWAIPSVAVHLSAQPLRYLELIDASIAIVAGRSVGNQSPLSSRPE